MGGRKPDIIRMYLVHDLSNLKLTPLIQAEYTFVKDALCIIHIAKQQKYHRACPTKPASKSFFIFLAVSGFIMCC